MTFPKRLSSLGRQQVFLEYLSRTHGLNVSTKAGLSEVTHWRHLTFMKAKGMSTTDLSFQEEYYKVWVFLGITKLSGVSIVHLISFNGFM